MFQIVSNFLNGSGIEITTKKGWNIIKFVIIWSGLNWFELGSGFNSAHESIKSNF